MGSDPETDLLGSQIDPASWPSDLHAVADWITEDVAQRLYASRQDLVEAASDEDDRSPAVAAVNAEVLAIIRDLRAIGTTLRSGPRTGTAARVEGLTTRVADRCESAQALIAQSAQLVTRSGRLLAESERLRSDALRLRLNTVPRNVPQRSTVTRTAGGRGSHTGARWRRVPAGTLGAS